MTTIELLQRLVIACQECDLVEAYTVQEMDEDILSLEELGDALAAAGALEAYRAGETIPWERVKAELQAG